MIFKSRKDALFILVIYGTCGILATVFIKRLLSDSPMFSAFILGDILSVVVIGLLLWINFDTYYELTSKELKYRSGPIRGTIALQNIKEVIKGKSLWSGLKPATARNGLIIKHIGYEEMYISPDSNDAFVEKLLQFNSEIKITNP